MGFFFGYSLNCITITIVKFLNIFVTTPQMSISSKVMDTFKEYICIFVTLVFIPS